MSFSYSHFVIAGFGIQTPKGTSIWDCFQEIDGELYVFLSDGTKLDVIYGEGSIIFVGELLTGIHSSMMCEYQSIKPPQKLCSNDTINELYLILKESNMNIVEPFSQYLVEIAL